MPLLTIHHKTEYRYAILWPLANIGSCCARATAMILHVLSHDLVIVPNPVSLGWIHDVFGNSVADL